MSISTFEYVKDALRYKSNGNYALAETALQRALTLDPHNISTLSELALLKMEQGDYVEAVNIINTINESKVLPTNLYRRAVCLLNLNKESEALSTLTDLELLQYDFRGAWSLRSDIYLRNKQYKEALACINIEIKNRPDELPLYNKRAEILLQSKKVDDALADYKKVCLADYKNVESYIPYVELLVQNGDYIEANTYLKQSFLYGSNERLQELNDIVIEKLGLNLK